MKLQSLKERQIKESFLRRWHSVEKKEREPTKGAWSKFGVRKGHGVC